MIFKNKINQVICIVASCCFILFHEDAFSEVYVQSDKMDCRVYFPGAKRGRATWSGGCKNGFAHGKGELKRYDGNKAVDGYEGDVRKGEKHGRGVFVSDYFGYEGWFEHDYYDGYGILLIMPDDKRSKKIIDHYRSQGFGDYVDGYYFLRGLFSYGDLYCQCEYGKSCDNC